MICRAWSSVFSLNSELDGVFSAHLWKRTNNEKQSQSIQSSEPKFSGSMFNVYVYWSKSNQKFHWMFGVHLILKYVHTQFFFWIWSFSGCGLFINCTFMCKMYSKMRKVCTGELRRPSDSMRQPRKVYTGFCQRFPFTRQACSAHYKIVIWICFLSWYLYLSNSIKMTTNRRFC